MEQLRMFLTGCIIVCVVTLVVNALLKKNPDKANTVIYYLLFTIISLLLSYAIATTNWAPVEHKLTKDLEDYRKTQRNVWRF